MLDEHFTAEDKLLNIIEHGIGKSSAQPGAAGNGKADKKRFDAKRIKRYFSLRNLNIVLAAAAVCLTFYWVYDVVLNKRLISARIGKLDSFVDAQPENTRVPKRVTILDDKMDLADLTAQAGRRNMFMLYQHEQEKNGAASVNLEALTKGYKLVGIFWSDAPQAMIESVLDGRTNLVSENETLGEFTIRKILPNKVVIGKDDKEWELR